MKYDSAQNRKMPFTILVFWATVCSAAAQASPDLTVVQFTSQIVSAQPLRMKLQAPKGHHFNQEAPAKVEILNGSEVAQTGKIEKSLQTFSVDFPQATKLAASCLVKAQIFVCNDDNTYCLPIKKEIACTPPD